MWSFGSVGPQTGWVEGNNDASNATNRTAGRVISWLELIRYVERSDQGLTAQGGYPYTIDGVAVEKGTVANICSDATVVVGDTPLTRYSRRLATEDATSILTKAIVRKARLKESRGPIGALAPSQH